SNMGELCVRSLLVTGANRGIGLGLVQHFLRMPNPPQWIFAGCRDPKGQRAQVRLDQEWCLQGAGATVRHLQHSLTRATRATDTLDTNVVDGKWRLLLYFVGLNSQGASLRHRGLVGSNWVLPLLKKAAQGSPGSGLSCSKAAIVNMSSIGGSITSPFPWDLIQGTSYRCSKAALNMLSKCQSLAYKEHGILCVALHPGWVQTDMGRSAGHT
ncbi:GSFK dehydrogenase, partial [Illadopsis cleaveri]|nr:GSFK dehydrogenase [Illadopsis cleaveri]